MFITILKKIILLCVVFYSLSFSLNKKRSDISLRIEKEWSIFHLIDGKIFTDNSVDECLITDEQCIFDLLSKELEQKKKINIMVYYKNNSSFKLVNLIFELLKSSEIKEILISFQEKTNVSKPPAYILEKITPIDIDEIIDSVHNLNKEK